MSTPEDLARRYLGWLLLTEGARAERLRAEAEVGVAGEVRSVVEPVAYTDLTLPTTTEL